MEPQIKEDPEKFLMDRIKIVREAADAYLQVRKSLKLSNPALDITTATANGGINPINDNMSRSSSMYINRATSPQTLEQYDHQDPASNNTFRRSVSIHIIDPDRGSPNGVMSKRTTRINFFFLLIYAMAGISSPIRLLSSTVILPSSPSLSFSPPLSSSPTTPIHECVAASLPPSLPTFQNTHI